MKKIQEQLSYSNIDFMILRRILDMKRLIHDQDGVYMIDEECLKKKEQLEREKEMRWQNNNNQRYGKDSTNTKNRNFR